MSCGIIDSSSNNPDAHTLPITLHPAALKVEATENYHILNDAQWSTTFTSSEYTKLGSDLKPYKPATYHQMRCLDLLRRAVVHYNWLDTSLEKRRLWHVNHCLNMMRQAILCNGDITLEPSYVLNVFNGRNQSAASGLDVMHVCRDWTQVIGFAKASYIKTGSPGNVS